MENPAPASPQGQGDAPQPGPAQRVQLTKEELRVLKECNSESFWYRCVPFGLTLSMGTQLLIQRGVLRPHPRYGSSLKHMGALLMGYILGKMAYQSKCREKIMQLEDSPLAAAMRKRAFLPDMAAAMGSIEQADIPADDGNKVLRDDYTSGDIDNTKVDLKGLDDHLRPSVDSMDRQLGPAADSSSKPNYTSYDNLRQKNRSDYDRKASLNQPPQSSVAQPSGPGTGGDQPSQPTPAPSRSYAWDTPPSAPKGGVRRNQYGDIIEE